MERPALIMVEKHCYVVRGWLLFLAIMGFDKCFFETRSSHKSVKKSQLRKVSQKFAEDFPNQGLTAGVFICTTCRISIQKGTLAGKL